MDSHIQSHIIFPIIKIKHHQVHHIVLVVKKSVPEETLNKELSAGIGYNYYYSPLVIDDDLKRGDTRVGYCSMKNTLSLNSIMISIMMM